MSSLTHYSQNDEQEQIDAWFASHPPKYGQRLADIGAWNGVDLSNSRALVERGWNAVLVEAAAGPFTKLMEHSRGFNNVRLVQALVIGDQTPFNMSRLAVLQHTFDAVSTTDPQVHAAWKGVIKDYFPVMMPVLRSSELLEAFPGPYDLVTLDVEGETFSIFCDLVSNVEVSLLVVEHAAGGRSYADEMRSLAASRGFQEVACNGENLIFGKP